MKATKKEAKRRLDFCKACIYFEPLLATCGTPIIGDDIKLNGEEKELCGCFLKLKTKIQDENCPLDFWNMDLKLRIKAFFDSANLQNLAREELQEILDIHKVMTGRDKKITSCKACYREILKKMKIYIK